MIRIYTDGSCLNNPGVAGAAWIILHPDGNQEEGGMHIPGKQTNNIAELVAAIEGLKRIPDGAEIAIYCDSRYVLGFIDGKDPETGTYPKTNSAKSNQDLVGSLKKQVARCSHITKYWIKSHNGDIYNERVDQLARECAENPNHRIHNVKTEKNSMITKYSREKLESFAIKHLLDLPEVRFADKIAALFSIDCNYNPATNSFDLSGDIKEI